MQKIQVTGNVASDIEVKKTGNGNEFVRFRMAHNERSHVDGQDDKTYWYSCVIFDSDLVRWAQREGKNGKYIRKGVSLYIEGEYSNNIYTRRDGTRDIDNSINVRYIEYWNNGPRSEDGNKTNAPFIADAPKTPQTANTTAAQPQQAVPQQSTFPGIDDELPF